MGIIKQIKIGKWFKLNINTKSISLVSALKGTRISVGKKGIQGSIGIPVMDKQISRVLVSRKAISSFIKAHKWRVTILIVFMVGLIVLFLRDKWAL